MLKSGIIVGFPLEHWYLEEENEKELEKNIKVRKLEINC